MGWVDRWNQGERSMPSEEIHPEVEIVSRLRPQPYRGPDGFQRWIDEIDEQFQEWRLAIAEWRHEDDFVVALGTIHLRGRTSDVQLDQPAGAILEVRDNRLVRLQLFGSREETLEAAGLRE